MVELRGSARIHRRVIAGRRRLFERLVIRALDELPTQIHEMLDNVQIVIEDQPDQSQLERRFPSVVGDESVLLGLYEGVPLTERSGSDGFQLPDKITLFRIPLERATSNQAELAHQIQVTVVHELAHHFGLDEDRIAELGWA